MYSLEYIMCCLENIMCCLQNECYKVEVMYFSFTVKDVRHTTRVL